MTRQKNVCEEGYLQDDKNNGKFQDRHPKRWSRKSGHAFVTNERWSFTRGSNCNDLTRKMLVVLINVIKRWSLMRGGRLGAVVAHGCLTAFSVICNLKLDCRLKVYP